MFETMSQSPVDRRGAAAAMQLGWIWKFFFVLSFSVHDFVPFVQGMNNDKHVRCSKAM